MNLLLQPRPARTVLALFLKVPWARVGGWLVMAKIWMLAVLKPLGVWGLLALSAVDSAAIPLPFLDPLVVDYAVNNHARCILYCLMAAVGSASGSLVPYFLGRAGGELFLLKRINRKRYERLRDRFEKQEFLAIMLPAMCPPPMPVKLFELAAGVFEMRVLSYFLAISAGKFLRFLIESILVILYGPAILTTALHLMHRHLNLVLGAILVVVMIIFVYILRRIFDRTRGVALPVEEELAVGKDDAL